MEVDTSTLHGKGLFTGIPDRDSNTSTSQWNIFFFLSRVLKSLEQTPIFDMMQYYRQFFWFIASLFIAYNKPVAKC